MEIAVHNYKTSEQIVCAPITLITSHIIVYVEDLLYVEILFHDYAGIIYTSTLIMQEACNSVANNLNNILNGNYM